MTSTPDEAKGAGPLPPNGRGAGQQPELIDLFPCHAWEDRREITSTLHDHLEAEGVSVWFSEKEILLGQPFKSQGRVRSGRRGVEDR